MEITVTPESTPNPQTYMFKINQNIADQNIQFNEAAEAAKSPLATKLFGFPWTEAVYIGEDFVSLTKQEWVDWAILTEPLCGLIKEHIEKKEPVLLGNTAEDDIDENDSEEVKLIKQVINKEIRPQVALDGGDIVFHKYENNIVYIYMQGACSGCPSSSITLKQGIEVRLQNALPEIKEVVAL